LADRFCPNAIASVETAVVAINFLLFIIIIFLVEYKEKMNIKYRSGKNPTINQ